MKSDFSLNAPVRVKRSLGLISLISIAVGVVVGQGAIISVLQGVGLGGANFLLALVLGLLIALCNATSFAELSLMFPRSSNLSTYTQLALGHFPAIFATFAGYVVVAMFGIAAELLLVGTIIQELFPGLFAPMLVAFGVVSLFVVLNIIGTDIFASVQNMLTFLMMLVLFLVGAIAVLEVGAPLPSSHQPFADWGSFNGGVLSLIALGLWAFMGLEFVCPMAEECKNPAKDIPRAMFLGALIVFAIYMLFALGAGTYLSRDTLATSQAPHLDYATAIFGEVSKWVIAIIVLTASGSTVNTVLASVSRMLAGMAENKQAFSFLKRHHPRFATPWLAVLFMGGCISSPIILIGNNPDAIITLLIAAVAAWLLAYIIAHIDVIVLRIRMPNTARPYKSPFYPWPQIFGILAMTYLVFNNSPSPDMTKTIYMLTGIVLGLVAVMSVFWVKFVMKQPLFSEFITGNKALAMRKHSPG